MSELRKFLETQDKSYLQQLAGRLNLLQSGSKAELVKRIGDADEGKVRAELEYLAGKPGDTKSDGHVSEALHEEKDHLISKPWYRRSGPLGMVIGIVVAGVSLAFGYYLYKNPIAAPNFTTLNNRGLTYYHHKQYDKAIADFTEAIRLNPQLASLFYNRGNTYDDLKQYDKALADYNEAIRLNPLYASAFNNRGLTYCHLKQYDKALADFTEAIRLNPQLVMAFYNRGNA